MCECGLAAGAGNPPRLAKHMNPMPPQAPVEVARAKQRRHLTRCLASECCVNTIQKGGWVGSNSRRREREASRLLAGRKLSSEESHSMGGSCQKWRRVYRGCRVRHVCWLARMLSLQTISCPRAGSPRSSWEPSDAVPMSLIPTSRQLRPRSCLNHGSGLVAKVQVPAIDR